MATIQITNRKELLDSIQKVSALQQELEDITGHVGYRVREAVRKAFNWLAEALRLPLPPLPMWEPAKTFADLTDAIDRHIEDTGLMEHLPAKCEEAAEDLLLMLEIQRIRHLRETLLGTATRAQDPVEQILNERIRQDDLVLRQRVETAAIEGGQPPVYPIPLNPDLPTVFKEFRSAFSASPEAITLFEELLKNGQVKHFYLLERTPNCVRYHLELKKDLAASRMFGVIQARITRDLEFKFTGGNHIELTKGNMCVKAPILGTLSYNEIAYLDEKDAPDPERKRRLLIVGYKAMAVEEWLALLHKYDIVLK